MSASRCTHLRTDGARCTTPAVNDKELCFYHEARLMRMRARPCPPSTFATAPLVSFVYPEDHDSIIENIFAIAQSLSRCDIDARTASVMDRLMNTALRCLRTGKQLEKTLLCDEMISAFRVDDHGNFLAVDTPPDPTPETEENSQPQPATIPSISAECDSSPSSPAAQSASTLPFSVLTKTANLNQPISAIGFKVRRNSTKLRAIGLFFRPEHGTSTSSLLNLTD